jgi:GMP synthase (glutamine-hydrolysing)
MCQVDSLGSQPGAERPLSTKPVIAWGGWYDLCSARVSAPFESRRLVLTHTLVISHVAFEDLGAFGPAIARRVGSVRLCEVGLEDVAALDPLVPDLVVVLGGPVGVYETGDYPFLGDEIAFAARRLESRRPLLGICLGAQIIARAAGARVYPSGVKEIGFAPITLTEAGRESCLAPFADDRLTLHWHGDTFDLPDGATLLASTAACCNQAFSIGPNIIGFQFHPEAGGPGFERWLIGHTVELRAAGIDVCALREQAAENGADLARKADAVINRWLDGLWLDGSAR